MLVTSERAEYRIDLLERLLGAVHYQALRPDHQADWTALAERSREIDARHGTAGARVVYLAAPPQASPTSTTAAWRAGTASRPPRGSSSKNPSAPTGPPRRS